MRSLIVAAAGPRLDSDTRETWLRRAADLVGVSFRQARAVYYGEISGPNCEAVRKFEAAAEQRAREGAAHLADQFDSLLAQLVEGAPFLDRREVDALYRVADKLRSAYGLRQD
ncbi:hypothetical protein BRDID11004_48030 [Bradyrhizobium diazoefficiens]|uniref:Uncharacterized protein n=1 Tax=Bradyrhizobium diazoefficiens TaxID=1355477 RepID=A0A809ZUN9_9BRAD|nr:hypothetical protein [Bradyrhizobium diazoefficiens]BBZ94294.1 hypothetical protein F07S3_41270 [Bradyrhizobium diazoefficiens]BCE56382.1 hypothetical protein XF5B_38940 [Bradyrhizobium diazoefficiens]